ncbi:MAG: hemolysin family protein [Pseudomonadota bacterium]
MPIASRTPEPPAEEDDQGGGFFGWMRRASGLGAVAEEEDEEGDALGPAFEHSTADELGMVRNILRMRERRVEDVMTPRADIVSVAEDADLETVMSAFSRDSLSRVPVYRETLDDPIGFVHLKDLALAFGVGCAKAAQPFTLKEHLRTALFVPPSMPIAALLKKMQVTRVHMALVIDEFGGVDGLVTIEDLVEQVVGDIEDEHDGDEGVLWREERDGVWLVNARADIAAFEEASGVSLTPEDWEEEADTLGGLVFMLTGRVPVRAEVIAHPAGHEFQIVDADPRRIKRLRLVLAGSRAAARPATPPRNAAE